MNKWEVLNKLYLDKELKIFPIKENAKTPLIPSWQNDCSCDYMQILYWYENGRNCNWGLPATQNGLFILDLDVHDENKNGVLNFEKLKKELQIEVETLTQLTPSGGIHLIFQSNDLLRNIPNSANIFKDYLGIDCRSDGYIVVEPSTINGKSYKFINNLSPMQMPIKLQQYIIDNVGTKTERKKQPYEKPKYVEIGNRDESLFNYITNLYYKTKLSYDEILLLANNFNEEVLEEPFPDKNVKYKVNKIFEKDRSECIVLWLKDDKNEKVENN